MSIKTIIQQLRKYNLDAYIVTHNNCFLGQDILEKENKIKKLCGFSGSAGNLIISKQGCFLLVDGRYELQAAQEVDLSVITVICHAPNLRNVCTLLCEKGLKRIGYDSWCLSIAEMEAIKSVYDNISFIDVGNLLGKNKSNAVQIKQRETKYAGQSSKQKLQKLIKKLNTYEADYVLLTATDSVSWLLNIYACDLPYTPIVRAFALCNLRTNKITLFADNLQTDIFSVEPMSKLENFLQTNDKKIICDFHTTPFKLFNLHLQHVNDICRELKAEKNKTELEGMKMCHIRDGVAIVKLLIWLENNWQGKTELDIVQKLHELRCKQKLFFSESFATIAAVGANGAIVHYQPDAKTNKILEQNQILLIDSGGQYLDGTTDVTRTTIIGQPTKEIINDFTEVLKAHITLASAQFPRKTSGTKLDALARSSLIKSGIDYKHGTGHGVACFGNVHEEPISLSTFSEHCLKKAMVTSIEPGVYQEGQYGIRIENLYFTEQIKDNLLQFVPLTMVPIDKKLINRHLLSKEQINWLNDYHKEVYLRLKDSLSETEKKWLQIACAPL